jgi:hypothetical protein
LYIRSLILIILHICCFVSSDLYLPLPTSNYYFAASVYLNFLGVHTQWKHIIFSLCVWLFSHSILFFAIIHVIANWQIPFFFILYYIFISIW